ncbi:motility associated factor glycosyltransferase family protein [Psychrobacillus sp. NPDC096426]|uniref:motility associated factor glycosyltransferase family protein n=1 Tax=Psychrobacillus sp. NPDC096426 TaxID=3364491 RepID=UPI00382DB9D3
MIQDFFIEQMQTKTPFPTIKVNDYFLHSKYDPQKEAEQFAKSQYSENHVHVLFGFGLGYYAEALVRNFNDNDRLLIVDPLITKIDSFFDKENYEIISDVTEKNIEIALDKLLNNYNVNVKLICSPNYDKLLSDQYKTVLKIVKDTLSVNTVFFNTVNYFAETWQENYIRNLFHVVEDESLVAIEKRYNRPIVIASGGPSLTKQIPLLKNVKNDIILIAAGSTVNTLLHYGIEADYIVSIDGSIANYNHFKETIFTNSKLIYSIRNHYQIREQFKTKAYAFIPSFEPGVYEHIEKLTNKQLPTLLGGASVANFALTIAQYISTGPIALIGQDLAYTDNKTHAEHNKQFTEVDDAFREGRHTFFTEGYYGDPILTDAAFLSMKKGFEQLAELSMEPDRFFNCTEGGVKINGYTQQTFQKFCEAIESSEEKTSTNNYPSSTLKVSEWKSLYDKVQLEIKVYNEIQNYLNRGLRFLKKNPSSIMFTENVIKELDKVDKKLKKMFERVSMNCIVEPISMDVMTKFLSKDGENKQEEYKRVYEQNYQLYDRLLKATKLSKQYTEDLLSQIKMKKLKGE